MIYYKKPNEVELIRENCLLVCKTLALAGSMLRPGITGAELDKKAEEFIRDHGAEPAFKDYRGFPASLCISPNEEVVHGIPNEKEFIDGDIVSIDCGVEKNGFFGDAAYTFALGDIDPEVEKLMQVTKEALRLGIQAARPGNKVGDISYAIQNYAERTHGYGIVRELVGHGLGRSLHESPEIPNFGRKGKGDILKPGLVIAIEPMVNMGTRRVKQYPDGWTIKSRDKKPSAHYEHTICVTKKGPDILSDHGIVEDAIKKNDNIREIAIKT